MTDLPPRPKRRRWRWMAAGLLLVILGYVGWKWRADHLLVRRARLLQVGQSKVEVIAALGQPDLTSFRGNAGSYCYGPGVRVVWMITALASKHLGVGQPLSISAFPIEVTFGDDGRVAKIRCPQAK